MKNELGFLDLNKIYNNNGVDPLFTTFDMSRLYFPQALIGINDLHNLARVEIRNELVRKEMSNEVVALSDFVIEISEPLRDILIASMENTGLVGSWDFINPTASNVLGEIIKKYELDERINDYHEELNLLEQLRHAEEESDFYRLAKQICRLSYRKYQHGKWIIFFDTHSAVRDKSIGLGGKLQLVEPDVRLYKPTKDEELMQVLSNQYLKLDVLHSNRNRKKKPMIVDHVMSTPWVFSLTSGEALYDDSFLVVKNLVKEMGPANGLINICESKIDSAKIEKLIILILALHESAHAYFWDDKDESYDDARFEEVFADCPTSIVVAGLEGFTDDEKILALAASYLPSVSKEFNKTAEDDWRYAISSNFILNTIFTLGAMKVVDGKVILRGEKLQDFETKVLDVHRRLWMREKLTREQLSKNLALDEVDNLRSIIIN